MSSFPVSVQKLAANQSNAQKSTGPKTPQGKAKVSQNASSHRIYSPFLLHEDEDESYFVSFRDCLLKDLFPQNFLELAHADRIIALHWKLRRLQSAEHHLNATQNDQFQKHLKAQREIIVNKRERHLDRCEEMGIDCTEEDLAELGLAEPDPDAPPLIPQSGYFLAQSLQTSHDKAARFTPEERLLNMETKLQSLLTRAIKDYRQLQTDRQTKEQAQSEEEDDGREPFCTFLTPTQNQEEEEIEPNQTEDDEKNESDTDEDSIPSSTQDHTAPQSATIPLTNSQIKPTTQSPPNSFGGFPPNQGEINP